MKRNTLVQMAQELLKEAKKELQTNEVTVQVVTSFYDIDTFTKSYAEKGWSVQHVVHYLDGKRNKFLLVFVRKST